MRVTTTASAVMLGIACTSAWAQIGDGRALDRNLRVGSGGRNPTSSYFADELRFRNAVVTGNAPGGLSFRGDVGYRAPGEFGASLSSDSLFAFRRDSVYSGLAGMGIRGTDALQYQFALTTGSTPPPSLTGTGMYLRAGAVPAGTNVAVAPAKPTDILTPGADTRGLLLWELRSPSAYVATRPMEPALVGVLSTQSGESIGVTASPLRGLATVGLPKPTDVTRRLADEALARQDLSAVKELTPPEKPGDVESAPPGKGKTPYETVMDRIKALPQGSPDAQPGTPGAQPGLPGVQPPADDKKPEQPEWKRRLDELQRMLEGKEPKKKPGPEESSPIGIDPKTLALLRAPEERLRALAAEGFDAYSRHMQAGEDHVAAGRYFQAEERFTAALSAKPGDPMASVGRIHAQLGNGLFLSAALNLRRLLIEHPELIAVRYSGKVLPAPGRLAIVRDRLDALVTDETAAMRRDAALLLAYLGYQSDDAAALERGLAGMTAGGATADDQLTRLAGVLRRVWVAPESPSPAPEPGLR
jgi:hypothetical protein